MPLSSLALLRHPYAEHFSTILTSNVSQSITHKQGNISQFIAHKLGNKKDTASTSKPAFNLVGPHFLQSAFVDHRKTAEILSQGAGSQSTTAAVERFPSHLSSMNEKPRDKTKENYESFSLREKGHVKWAEKCIYTFNVLANRRTQLSRRVAAATFRVINEPWRPQSKARAGKLGEVGLPHRNAESQKPIPLIFDATYNARGNLWGIT